MSHLYGIPVPAWFTWIWAVFQRRLVRGFDLCISFLWLFEGGDEEADSSPWSPSTRGGRIQSCYFQII